MSDETPLRSLTTLLEMFPRWLTRIEQLLSLQAPRFTGNTVPELRTNLEQRFAAIEVELERQRSTERDSREAGNDRVKGQTSNWNQDVMGITEDKYRELQENCSSLQHFLQTVLKEWYGSLELVNLGRAGRTQSATVMSHERRHQLYRLSAVYSLGSESEVRKTSFDDLGKMLAHMLANAKRSASKRCRSGKDGNDGSSDSQEAGRRPVIIEAKRCTQCNSQGGSREGQYRPEVSTFEQLMDVVYRQTSNWDQSVMRISEDRYRKLREDSSCLQHFLQAVLEEWYGNLAVVNLGRAGRPCITVMSHERRDQLYRLAAFYSLESEPSQDREISFDDLGKMLAHMLANAKRRPSKSHTPEPKKRRSEKDYDDGNSNVGSSF